MDSLAALELEFEFDLNGDFLPSDGNRAGFLLLLGFLLSFGFIRMSTRLMRDPRITWWPGSIETGGGLHIHHLVFGIVLLLLAGFLGFALQPDSPWLEILAVAFGVGGGLTLDEFALWLHLEDVYWSEEGRSSVDAVIMAAIVGGAVVVGLAPLEINNEESAPVVVATVGVNLAVCVFAVLKGKLTAGLIGMFIPVVGYAAAIRLAKPSSPWARRRYPADSKKLAAAEARDARHERRYRRWQDLIGGRPTPVAPLEGAPEDDRRKAGNS
ncbi:MAG: hypothetical protein ACR2IN_01550 [Thermoleophilaceae bacterium]|jgi:hypothetical protein